MSDHSTAQCQLFPNLFGKSVAVRFDQRQGSSDGGALLVGAADRRLGLTERLSSCLSDQRTPDRVVHTMSELVMQRVYGLACGYADTNDAGRLADDPIHKLLLGRDAVEGASLASQPTLSRFENGVSRRELYRMGLALMETVVGNQRRKRRGKARRITIDLDVTADEAHGEQQLSFFNGFYNHRCYLPLLAFISFDKEKEQYLAAAVLRPGNAPDKRGVIGVLRRLIARLRCAFGRARLRVRMDGGFCAPEILEFLDDTGVEYIVGMQKNKRLERRAERLMRRARRASREQGDTGRQYGDCRYASRTWPYQRRIVIKAEVTQHPGREPKDNPRFLVTNLRQSPRWIYEEVYCFRGEVENRIKELQLGMQIDRTSCSSFWANQFRVLLTSAAYVLLQEIRDRAAHTGSARSQVWTLRETLLKIGARVIRSTRRVVVHLPESFPFQADWQRIAYTLGAVVG